MGRDWESRLTQRSGVVNATERVARSPSPRGWHLKLDASPASITRYSSWPTLSLRKVCG